MVAAGRSLHWAYFDHPPLAWWLAWGAAHLFGTEAAVAVRAPFIALFALSTWLMARLGRTLHGPRAGLWAAVGLNLAPVFGVTSGSWVLPDGPLIAALLGAALCLVRAVEGGRWAAWLGAGALLGLALAAKYTALLTAAGALVFLATSARHRPWLARPQPYIAALVGALVFSPVLVWNARHGWASFAFQGARAGGAAFHPLAPLAVLAGEAVFLLPWLWAGLIASLIAALRRGPSDWRGWLCAMLALPPILLFAAVAVWSRQRVLFHWAAPGYLFLFPLLGQLAAARAEPARRWAAGTALFLALLLAALASDARWNWLGRLHPGADPLIEAVDWDSVRSELAGRGLLAPDGPVIAALRWQDAGKLAYALGPGERVVCLGADPRQFGADQALDTLAGRTLLIVAPRFDLARLRQALSGRFASLTALPPAPLRHGGDTVLDVPLFLGTEYRPPG